MAYNLARNSRVFVTTNLNASTGAVLTTGLTALNTWEIQILDGFTFSQGTNQATISINEAGSTPIRGQRAFNTALNPVEISFSTYLRPRLNSTQPTAEEKVLWNALFGAVGIDGQGGTPNTFTTVTAITRSATTANSATLTGTGLNSVAVGDVGTFKAMTGTGADWWNQPAKVTSLIGTTNMTVDYLTAPVAAAGVTFAAGGTVKFDKAAWVDKATLSGTITSYGQVTSAPSNKNQLQAIGFIFLVDSTVYTIDNCAMDGATLDFGLDAISTIAWTAKGTKLTQVATATVFTDTAQGNGAGTTMTGGLTGTALLKYTAANYITNKLSTVTMQANIGGGGTSYTIVLTGGSLQIANNINYVTPNNIGTVNLPIGYYTGARAVSGTLNAYLRTGTGYAADLLSTMLTNAATSSETKYKLQVEIGGATAGTRVAVLMNGVVLGIPSVDIADVVSTAITFSAQGNTGVLYDIENTNDIDLRYYSL